MKKFFTEKSFNILHIIVIVAAVNLATVTVPTIINAATTSTNSSGVK